MLCKPCASSSARVPTVLLILATVLQRTSAVKDDVCVKDDSQSVQSVEQGSSQAGMAIVQQFDDAVQDDIGADITAARRAEKEAVAAHERPMTDITAATTAADDAVSALSREKEGVATHGHLVFDAARIRRSVALLDFALDVHEGTAANTTTSGKTKVLLLAFEYPSTPYTIPTLGSLQAVFPKLRAKGFNPADFTIVTDAKALEFSAGRPTPRAQQILQTSFNGVPFNQVHYVPGASPDHIFNLLHQQSQGVDSGDHFVLHMTGHGNKAPDAKSPVQGDELDNEDEALFAPNYQLTGEESNMYDDLFYVWLTTFPEGVTVTWVADVCHSEGLSDLPFNYDPGDFVLRDLGNGRRAGVFQSSRSWCTDWAVPRESLPLATIRYFSGSQNNQESKGGGVKHQEQGAGGAFTDQLVRKWSEEQGGSATIYERFSKLISEFETGTQGGSTSFGGGARINDQKPNICAFPTFRDDSEFTLWNFNLAHDQANGGDRPPGATMVVPSVCRHGGRTRQLGSGFRVDSRLDSAQGDQYVTQGWEQRGDQQAQVQPQVFQQPQGQPCLFPPNSAVEYLSLTQGSWLPAIVLAFDAMTGLYDLNIRPGATRDKIRWPASGAPAAVAQPPQVFHHPPQVLPPQVHVLPPQVQPPQVHVLQPQVQVLPPIVHVLPPQYYVPQVQH